MYHKYKNNVKHITVNAQKLDIKNILTYKNSKKQKVQINL